MQDIREGFGRFSRRVRWLRAWRGLAVGATLGGLAAGVLATLDYFGVAYTEWRWLGLCVGIGALLGAAVGAALPVRSGQLASSLDRRARLKDRVSTALEVGEDGSTLAGAQHADASASLQGLKPAAVFPVRFGKWQVGALSIGLLAACIFLLGNTQLLMSSSKRAEVEDLKKTAEAVQRVASPLLEKKDGEMTPEEKRLAEELKRLIKDLEKGRRDKKDALQDANDILEKAEELTRDRFQQSDRTVNEAKSAYDKLMQEKLRDAGFEKADPELMKKSDSELDSLLKDVEKQIQQIREKLKNDSLSEAEKEALKNQLKDLQEKKQSIELSKKAREFLEQMQSMPEFRELQELMAKMQRSSQQGQQGKQRELTDEQIKEMIDKLEKMADELNTDEKKREYLRKLIEALKQQQKAGECQGMCSGLGLSLGLGTGMGNGGRSTDRFFSDTGYVPQTDQERTMQSNPDMISVTGQRREEGEEAYIEVRGPASLGAKSKTPYSSVLPQYKKSAEQALDKNKIPKAYQKRVREYFNSLEGGK